MRLLRRYVVGQLVGPFLFALTALTSIMLLNQVARRFGALVGKGLPWSVIGEVFALSVPFIVAMTLPMAILVAVLYTFSHLGADNEITAMRASGISVGQMVLPVVLVGSLLTVVNFAFVDQILPRTNARLRTLLLEIGRKKPTFDLREQVINEIPPSLLYLRAGRIDGATGRLRDVTIYDLGGADARRVIYADSGRMAFREGETDLGLDLYDGAVHAYKNSDPLQFQLTYFRVNRIRVKDVANQLERGTTEIARGDREMSTCEMLAIVRDSEAQAAEARRTRAHLLDRDLRALLGLPPAGPPPPPQVAPPAGYCAWWDKALERLLPRTAEAQSTTQEARPARPRPTLPRYAKPATPGRDSGLAIDLAAPEPPVPAGEATLSTWADVSQALDREQEAARSADKFGVEVHKKWAISVACLIFVLVGIPMALRFPRGGMGLVIGGGLAVFAIYYVGLTAGEGLGDLGRISPAVAMWSPNIILLAAALIGLHRVRRESGSTRGGDLTDLADVLLRWVRWLRTPRRRA